MRKEMTCIICPIGCKVEIDYENGSISAITGNNCKRGADYAAEEISAPKRMVTTTVKVIGGDSKRLPVRTSTPIDKAMLGAVIEALKSIEVHAPIALGDVIIHNIFDTDIHIIASGETQIQQ